MEYAQEMELKKFKASEGWLTNFRSRHWKFFKGIGQVLDSNGRPHFDFVKLNY